MRQGSLVSALILCAVLAALLFPEGTGAALAAAAAELGRCVWCVPLG